MIHSTKTIDDLKLGNLKQLANGNDNQKSEYTEIFNGGFDGYDACGTNDSYPSGASNKSNIDYEVNF